MPGRLAPIARTLVAVVAALGLGALALQIAFRCTLPLGNSDVFWQVRTGQIALASGHVPDADPFSYTIHGEPWNNHEWIFEILAALLHRAFGWGAFRLLVLVAWGGSALAIGIAVARRAGVAPALLAVSLFHALAGYKLKPVPQTIAMPMLLAALHLFRGPAMLTSRRRAAALAGYLLVWGNLTAEALTFLPFLLLDQICLRHARREGDPPADRTVTLLLVLAALAPLVNPPWSSVLDYVVRGTAVNRAVNAEFTPIWAAAAAVTPMTKLVGRAVVALYVPWAAYTLHRAEDRWATLRAVGPGLLAVAAAVLLERDLWLLVVPAATMLLALAKRAPLVTGAAAAALGLVVHVAYAASIGWSSAVAWAAVRDPHYRAAHLDEGLVPVACVEHLAGAPAETRLFTLRMWASYAIWRLPDVRVFYDGRNLEYGRDLYEAGSHVWAGGPAAGRILDETRSDVVIARPGWNELPGLRGGPWRAVFAGPKCVVYRRAAGSAAP